MVGEYLAVSLFSKSVVSSAEHFTVNDNQVLVAYKKIEDFQLHVFGYDFQDNSAGFQAMKPPISKIFHLELIGLRCFLR